MNASRLHPRQQGAALIAAMITVSLVALLAASAQWRQWQQVEVEAAQRTRQQASWILVGALDWSRLILREDERSNSVDHLAEPWALPLQDAQLGTFLGADNASDTDNSLLKADLSGKIADVQAKLNFANLIQDKRVSETDLQVFERLFEMLDLPHQQLLDAAERYRDAMDTTFEPGTRDQLIAPVRWSQLTHLGLSSETLNRLAPFVTLLPTRTKVNLNTASAEVLRASIRGLDAGDAQRLVQLRSQTYFKSLPDVLQVMPSLGNRLDDARMAVASQYFEISGQLRVDNTPIQEKSLVFRDGSEVRVVWRQRMTQPGS